MTFDPHELHRAGTLGNLRVDRLDQRRVLHRLLLRILPTVLLPAVHPLGGTVDGILRIRFDHQRFGTRMRAQRLQYGAQFTDLVGAVRGAAGIAVTGMVMAGSAARIQVVIGPFGLPSAEPSVETVIVMPLPYGGRATRIGSDLVEAQHDRRLEHLAIVFECRRAAVPFGRLPHRHGA